MRTIKILAVALLLMASSAFGQVGVKFSKVQIRDWLEVSPAKVDSSLFETYIAVLNGIVKANAIVVGNNNRALAGLIRFDGAHFWGYTPSGWVQLDGGSGSGGGGGVTSFKELTDTPANYTGFANNLVKVNSTEDMLEFVAPANIKTQAGWISGKPITTTAPTNGKILKYNSSTGEIEWADDNASGGVASLGELNDGPGDYGSEDYILQSDGDASWHWVAYQFSKLTDTPNSYSGSANYFVTVNNGATGLTFQNSSSVYARAGWAGTIPVTKKAPSTDGKILKYDSAQDSLVWADDNSGTGGSSTFEGLSDTPTGYGTDGQCVMTDGSQIVYGWLNFTDLLDTPANYNSSGGFILAVKSTNDGVEFKGPSSVTTNAGWINHIPITSASPSSNQILKYNSTSGQLEWAADNTGSGSGASTLTDLTDGPGDYGDPEQILQSDGSGGWYWQDYTLKKLTDVPYYTGNGGKVVAIKSDTSGVEYLSQASLNTNAIKINGIDVTGNPASGQVLKYNGTEWAPATDQHTTTFLQLTDTPSDYSTSSNYKVVVNSSGDAISFRRDFLTDLGNVSTSGLSGNHFLVYNGTNWTNQYGVKKSQLVNSGTLPFKWSTSELADEVMTEGENVSLLTNDAGYTKYNQSQNVTGQWVFTKAPQMPFTIQTNVVNPDSLFLENQKVMVWQNVTGAEVKVDSVIFKVTRNSGYVVSLWYGDQYSMSSGQTKITEATVTSASGDGMYWALKKNNDIQNAYITANKQLWIKCDDSVDAGQLFVIVYMHFEEQQ